MASFRGKRWHRRYILRASMVFCVIGVTAGWLALYLRDSIRASNEMRADAERIRSLQVARFYAAHLNREFSAATTALNAIATQPAVIAAVRGGRHGAGFLMGIVLAGVPGLTSVSVYSDAGRRTFVVSRSKEDEPLSIPASTLSEISRTGHASYGLDGHLTIVAPIISARHTIGFLVARLAPTASLPAGEEPSGLDAAVYVMDVSGRGINVSGGTGEKMSFGANFEPLVNAQKRPSGTLILFEPLVRLRTLVGYAAAKQAGLVVMTFVPVETALAPSRFLVRRIGYIVIPAFGLVVVAAWVIGAFYYKQRKLAFQLVKHNTRLREVNRAKSDFLANVSHDLRTPLASLRVCLSALQDPDIRWDDAQARSFVQAASEQADHLSARVRNLLDMARIESNNQPLLPEMCDLTDIAASAIDRLRPLLKGRRIHVDFPCEPLFVECDQVQVATVILNFLENALKYSPDGTPIAIKGTADNPYMTMTVTDEGSGVAAADEGRVFDKFYRSPDVASIGGTGLGLAICKSIIEQHGGRIGVRRGALGGAEFWFSLPAPLMDMAVSPLKGTAR